MRRDKEGEGRPGQRAPAHSPPPPPPSNRISQTLNVLHGEKTLGSFPSSEGRAAKRNCGKDQRREDRCVSRAAPSPRSLLVRRSSAPCAPPRKGGGGAAAALDAQLGAAPVAALGVVPDLVVRAEPVVVFSESLRRERREMRRERKTGAGRRRRRRRRRRKKKGAAAGAMSRRSRSARVERPAWARRSPTMVGRLPDQPRARGRSNAWRAGGVRQNESCSPPQGRRGALSLSLSTHERARRLALNEASLTRRGCIQTAADAPRRRSPPFKESGRRPSPLLLSLSALARRQTHRIQ